MQPPPRQPRGLATGATPWALDARSHGTPAGSGRRAPADAGEAEQREHEARSGAPDAGEGKGQQGLENDAGWIPPPPAFAELCPASFCRRRRGAVAGEEAVAALGGGARPSRLRETTRGVMGRTCCLQHDF